MFALYLRQSQDTTGQGVAIERQRTECEAYAQAHGITLGREYVDNDRSATSGVRPEYQRLLVDVEAGRVTGVLAWDLDRLHRQPRELEAFIDLADTRHIRLATVTGEADLSTDTGRLYARLKGAVARHEQEHKAARQMARNRQLATAGDLQPKERPFGWRRTFEGSRPVFNELDPREAPAIRAAVDALLSGSSALSVYKAWNARALLTTKGNLWDNDKFRKMLLRERNAGLLTYNGATVKATCEPIITTDELSELQAITASRVRQTHGERKSGFSGVPRCVCGHRMYRRADPKSTYICANPEQLGHNGVSSRILEEAMWHALRYKVAESTPEKAVSEVLEAIAATRARLAKLDAQDAEVMATKVSVKARLVLLSESQRERGQLETQLAFLASRSRQAALLDGVTANPRGRISFDRHAEIGSRLKALPVLDLYDLTEAMLSVVIHPLPGPRKGRLPSSEIVRRIEIDGVRLGEDADPYEGV
jgi:DNA invertase Pin-like site-specific DNA recombinase